MVRASHSPTASTPSCAIRGEGGGAHSLALVNDGLAAALEARGHVVLRREPGSRRDLQSCPTITHSWPPDFSPGTEGPTIAVLPWEHGAPPVAWVHAARDRCDRIWVPSAFVRDGYVAGGMPPGIVDVVPNGVDLDRFAPAGPTRTIDGPDAGCTFLFVGGTIWRKGIDVLLEAWTQAFGPEDDVRLIVKDVARDGAYAGQTADLRLAQLASRDDVAPVIHMTEQLAPEELPALYRAADVVVLPYRGEGFCLPALEAMACGVPVIHTAAGPTGEFVPLDAGWPLASRRVAFAARTSMGDLVGPACALEVDPAALARVLRAVADEAGDRAHRGLAARRAAERLGWDAVAAIAEERLAELMRTAPAQWARAVVPPEIETRGTAVLYAPDWERPQTWEPVVRMWARVFGDADDVTLVLAAGEGEDREVLAARLLTCLEATGRPSGALPDVLLDEPAANRVHRLIARSDAVLLDGTEIGARREQLTRRALRTLIAHEPALAAFAAHLRPTRTAVAAAAA